MGYASNNWFTVNDIARGCSQRREYGHILTFGQSQDGQALCRKAVESDGCAIKFAPDELRAKLELESDDDSVCSFHPLQK